jgi:hypothetical protein
MTIITILIAAAFLARAYLTEAEQALVPIYLNQESI